MSSVRTRIAQIPSRTKFLLGTNTSAFEYPPASVESATTGVLSQVGTIYVFNSVANATATTDSTCILNGGSSIVAGRLYRNMGRIVTVYVNNVHLYTLTLVQRQITDVVVADAQTEGVGGSPNTTTPYEQGFNDSYVVTWSANPGTAGILVGVADI